MTEGQWFRSTDSTPMLEYLREGGIASRRKLQLFASACCRRVWHLLDADGRAVIETSERFADGLATEEELMAAVWTNRGTQSIEARAAVDDAAVGAWLFTVALLADCGPGDPASLVDSQVVEKQVHANLLRGVLGPWPFRTLRLDPRWRTPLVLSLAQTAYEERVASDPLRPGWLTLDRARLLVLADALEETGADDDEILEHLRGSREHVRGCWSVDLLLERA